MPAPPDFRALFDRSPNPYMLLDTGLAFVEANEAYLRVTGRTRESVIGRHVFDAFPDDPDHPGQSARVGASVERVFATGETDTLALIRYTIPRETPGGTVLDERFWTVTHTPIFGEGGAVAFVLQHAVDVTELHRLHTATRASDWAATGGAASDGESTAAATSGPSSRPPASDDGVVFERARVAQQEKAALGDEVRRLRSVFDQAPAFICSLEGPDHVFRYLNDAYRDLLGQRDLLGIPVRVAVPEADGQGFFELLDRVYATGEPFRGDAVPLRLARTPGGGLEQRYVDFVYGPLRDSDGAIRGVLVHGVDVTERVLARRALDELRGVNDLLLAHSPDVLCVLDAAGRFAHMGAAAMAVFGYAPAEMEGRHFSDFLHPDDRAANIGRGFAEGTPLYTATNRYLRRDGATVYMEWSASWPEGSPGMLGVGRDVTARRAQEETLRERTAMLQTLLANLPGTVVYQAVRAADGQTRFTYLSDGVETLHGVTAAEALADPGLVYGQVVAPHDAVLAAAEEEALRTGAPFLAEVPFRHPDGTVRWIRLASAPRRAADGTTVWEGAEVDVTSRRLAEDALRESHSRLDLLISSMDQGYALCELVEDADGAVVDVRYLDANDAFAEATGVESVRPGQTAREVTPGLEAHWLEMMTRAGRGRERLRVQNEVAALGRWFECLRRACGTGRFRPARTALPRHNRRPRRRRRPPRERGPRPPRPRHRQHRRLRLGPRRLHGRPRRAGVRHPRRSRRHRPCRHPRQHRLDGARG